MGSPIDLVDSALGFLEAYAFDEFGCLKNDGRKSRQPFGYAGFYKDEVADLYFVQMREYDERTGRFVSKDSAVKKQSMPFTMQDYAYCFNSPIEYVDLNGAFPTFSDIGDFCCDVLDDIGKGIDYVTEEFGKQLDTVTTGFFDVCDWVYDQCPEPVQDVIKGTISYGGRIAREICEYDIPFTNTDLSDIWHYVSTNTRIGNAIMDTADFYETGDGIYHTRSDCWQRAMGYNNSYDLFFDSFTAMDRNKDITFHTADGTEYTIWMWKGDYYNLGAGCETGIYYGNNDDFHLSCATDTNLKMTVHMVDAEGNVIADWAPDNEEWWITNFNSNYQDYTDEQIQGCVVTGTIDFSGNENLFCAFLNSYEVNAENGKIDSLCIDVDNYIIKYRW